MVGLSDAGWEPARIAAHLGAGYRTVLKIRSGPRIHPIHPSRFRAGVPTRVPSVANTGLGIGEWLIRDESSADRGAIRRDSPVESCRIVEGSASPRSLAGVVLRLSR